MRISIITPSYNQAPYLEETIRSVLSQDGVEIEYWIMDGGSSDGSVDIIRRYESSLAGWLSEKDRGQADALNKGFARATGDLVAWINSDDYYQPGAVKAAVDALEQNPECGLVYGDVLAIDGAGAPINVMRFAQWGLADIMRFRVISQPAVFMRRSVLMQAGGLDESYQYLLDQHLWLRMLQAASMKYVPQVWAAARYHEGAKNLTGGVKYGREALRLVEWMPAEPGLAELYQQHRRKIWAGYHCYDAHYRLDSGDPKGAFRAYLRALGQYPPAALANYRRMAFSAVRSVVNIDAVKDGYLKWRKRALAKPSRDL